MPVFAIVLTDIDMPRLRKRFLNELNTTLILQNFQNTPDALLPKDSPDREDEDKNKSRGLPRDMAKPAAMMDDGSLGTKTRRDAASVCMDEMIGRDRRKLMSRRAHITRNRMPRGPPV